MMFIIRFIIIIAIGWLILMLIGWLTKKWLLKKLQFPNQQKTGAEKTIETQPLIKCAHCNTYITKESAIIKEGDPYCSEAHAKANQCN